MTMNTDTQELIPTSIRLDRETLRELNEAAALQQSNRTELIRQGIAEILTRWTIERKAFIQKLMEVSS
jgi:predicted transcriptional regulator